jgi:hypothetical protein
MTNLSTKCYTKHKDNGYKVKLRQKAIFRIRSPTLIIALKNLSKSIFKNKEVVREKYFKAW